MDINKSELVSSYLQYLPAILQEDPFMGRFLLAFEKILSGVKNLPSDEKIIQGNSENVPGLEEVISQVETYFDPQKTPEQFLPWLANWVALSLRDDWETETKQAFIQGIVKLYRQRGTKEGLTEVLRLYLKSLYFENNVEIFDQFNNFPNYFQVLLTLDYCNPDKYWRQYRIAKAIIDQEKPAHTFYSLKILVPTMQLTKPPQINNTFQLFNNLQDQNFTLEIAITSSQEEISNFSEQLIVQIQGNKSESFFYSPSISRNDKGFYIEHKVTYQQFLSNLSNFYITLSNRTSKRFEGRLKVRLAFTLNSKVRRRIILNKSLSLSPALKICLNDELGSGNTVLQSSGMQITQFLRTNSFSLFNPSKKQKIVLEATVQITKNITKLLNIYFQDKSSSDQLLVSTFPNSSYPVHVTIRRQLNYQQFFDSLNQLNLIIKNFSNIKISGKIKINLKISINNKQSIFTLKREKFTLDALLPENFLKIYSDKSIDNAKTKRQSYTVLGTLTQKFKI